MYFMSFVCLTPLQFEQLNSVKLFKLNNFAKAMDSKSFDLDNDMKDLILVFSLQIEFNLFSRYFVLTYILFMK